MTDEPEPQRNQRTIGSYKRTFNAALLILATKYSVPPAAGHPVARRSFLVAMTGVVVWVLAGRPPL